MGQYKLSFYFVWQIGITIRYLPKESFDIKLPFIRIYYGLMDMAKGVRFFKD